MRTESGQFSRTKFFEKESEDPFELFAQVVGPDKSYRKQYAKCYIAKICDNHFFR